MPTIVDNDQLNNNNNNSTTTIPSEDQNRQQPPPLLPFSVDPVDFSRSTIDPIQIVLILDRANEKTLFEKNLQVTYNEGGNSSNTGGKERIKFILDIIDRVRKTFYDFYIASQSDDSDIGGGGGGAENKMDNNSLLLKLSERRRKNVIVVPENLHRNFVTVALPEILKTIKMPNLERQGIQSFSSSCSSTTTMMMMMNNNDTKTTETNVFCCFDSEKCNSLLLLRQQQRNQKKEKKVPCCCTAQRLFISAKHGATNEAHLRYLGITDFVKCCEYSPVHQGSSFSQGQAATYDFSNVHICDVGVKDDETVPFEVLSENFDKAVDFVKARLSSSPDAKVLVFCQAGKHRSAWFSAVILAALSRDPKFACPCLEERTRYHSSLVHSVTRIVKNCRSFVEFSPQVEEKIAKWIQVKKLKAFVSSSASSSENDDDDDDDIYNNKKEGGN